MILLGCLAVLLVAGLVERVALARARRAVPIRIHVNGTRGKSTVTRLVAGALREAGIPTLAKVTGTEPRLVLPDGRERPIRRLAPPTIREQAWALRQAHRHGARALVAECMAVRPDLQWASERDILKSTHGVVTNVRLDHIDVMGRTIEQIARALANTVPRHGVVITGDPRAATVLSERCAQEGSRLVVVPPGNGVDPDQVCLAVARELGIDEATALRGMRKAAPDPGVAVSGTAMLDGKRIEWLDVTAANDPESTDLMVGRWAGGASATPGAGALVCVYNHRDDRPERLTAFTRWSTAFAHARSILVTGDRPAVLLARRVRRTCRADVRFVRLRDLSDALARVLGAPAHIGVTRLVYCGNVRGFVRPVLER